MTTRVIHQTSYEFPLDRNLYGQTFVIGNHTKYSDLETAVVSYQNDINDPELIKIQETLASNKFNTKLKSSKDLSGDDLLLDWASKGNVAMAYHYFYPHKMREIYELSDLGKNINFYIHLHCMTDIYFNNINRDQMSNRHIKIKSLIESLIDKVNPQFIAVSDGVKKSFVETSMIPTDKIKVVKNGVSSELYNIISEEKKEEFRKNLGINADRLVGYCGRLENVKGAQGLLTLLGYYNQNPRDLGFVIASSGGEQFTDFARQVKNVAPKLLETNKLKFCLDASKLVSNFYSKDELLNTNFYKNIKEKFADLPFVDVITTPLQPHLDVYVQPSVSEGISLSIIEALMSGVPVVASNVGGIPEVVNFNNGTLIDVQNIKPSVYKMDFAEAIGSWLKKPIDEGHAKLLRQNLINAGFDAKTMAQKLDNIYLSSNQENI